ncbi:7-cyano-7-deazaguanine synthase [Paenibacillus macerans]|uniref:7-cyano-7-deazaguanine synthase n=1 Tax=Paenibacillus macerans TaxID=44252 RepID=UPI00203CA735|nr:7-cyano-7-deazaguanine synthase [Paenibacillus macerans]MCM3697883.1 7-cyano-7-deazaguanine synthase [Paenibacillus macerans]
MENPFIKEFGAYPHEMFLKNLTRYESAQDGMILDLVDVFSTIFFMDIMTKRNNDEGRTYSITVPVTNPDLWEQIEPSLKKLIRFVSRDNVDFNFTLVEKKYIGASLELDFGTFNNVSLLSGGLDSFSGAFQNITSGISSIYVGYKLNTFEQSKQELIASFVMDKHINSIGYFFDKINCNKAEPTQATRSLLFLSLATAVAYEHKVTDILIYENGFLSLNPFKNGRFTTKTTHPKTIYLFNSILALLGLMQHVSNPFIFETKGDIIHRLSEEFKEQIKNTHTCSKSRQYLHLLDKKKQCGTCIPCVLRKISLAAHDNEKYDEHLYDVGYDGKNRTITLEQVEDLKSSIEYFRECKKEIDDNSILLTLGLKKTFYADDDYYWKTSRMLRRFSEEVERFLDKYDIF